MSRTELAAHQEALVAALVGSRPAPAGFDRRRLDVAEKALLHKRAREVEALWPALRAAYGTRWEDVFRAFAGGRPSRGALHEGWELARASAALPERAALELADHEVRWIHRKNHQVRPRRLPALRRTTFATVVQIGGRLWTTPRRNASRRN